MLDAIQQMQQQNASDLPVPTDGTTTAPAAGTGTTTTPATSTDGAASTTTTPAATWAPITHQGDNSGCCSRKRCASSADSGLMKSEASASISGAGALVVIRMAAPVSPEFYKASLYK